MNMGVRYGTFRPVDGLGERAFVLDMRAAGAAICVFRTDYYLQVSVFKAGDAAAVLPGVERLVKTALARVRYPPEQ